MSSWSMSICSLMVPDSSSAKNILRPSLHIGEGRDLWGQYALLLLAFEQSFGDGVGDALHHLDQYDHDDHGRPGHRLVDFLITVQSVWWPAMSYAWDQGLIASPPCLPRTAAAMASS